VGPPGHDRGAVSRLARDPVRGGCEGGWQVPHNPAPYALDAASEVNGRRDGLLGLVATARLLSMSDDMGAAAKGSGRLGSVDTGCFVRDHLRRRALGQAIPAPNQDR
jgi:hypothetical protein